MDWTSVSIKRWNEIGAHSWALILTRRVAIRAWHTGAAAGLLMLRVPGLIGVILADPAGAPAAGAPEC